MHQYQHYQQYYQTHYNNFHWFLHNFHRSFHLHDYHLSNLHCCNLEKLHHIVLENAWYFEIHFEKSTGIWWNCLEQKQGYYNTGWSNPEMHSHAVFRFCQQTIFKVAFKYITFLYRRSWFIWILLYLSRNLDIPLKMI